MALNYLVSSVSSGLTWVLSLYICFVLFCLFDCFCFFWWPWQSWGIRYFGECSSVWVIPFLPAVRQQIHDLHFLEFSYLAEGNKQDDTGKNPTRGQCVQPPVTIIYETELALLWVKVLQSRCVWHALVHWVAFLWNHRIPELEGIVGACGLTCHCCLKACSRAGRSREEVCAISKAPIPSSCPWDWSSSSMPLPTHCKAYWKPSPLTLLLCRITIWFFPFLQSSNSLLLSPSQWRPLLFIALRRHEKIQVS